MRSHADTLDQLTTAVAIFDSSEKLRFFNQAFQKLWDLDHGFLASAPDNALLLDRLRSEGKIAEQPEWRRWKENLLVGLPLGRFAGALVAPARRPHHPRRRQPAAQGRRHLGVREPDREDGSRKPLQHGGARAGRDARQSGRRRRRVRPGRPHPPVQPGLRRAVGAVGRHRRAEDAYLGRSGRAASRWPRTAPGRASSPRSPASTRSAATATARPN